MFRYPPLCITLMLLFCLPAYAGDTIGFRQITLPDPDSGRVLQVAIWYPTDDMRKPSLVGDNPAFVGVAAVRDAPARPGSHPVVILSHGYGGNWRNQSWLAGELARHGYIAAAPNHPGTTSRDMLSPEAAKLWERPRDISRVIDALAADSVGTGTIAPDRIAVIGQSLGGWTVVELAGGLFDPDRLAADCEVHAELAACEVYRKIGAGRDAESKAALAQTLRDTRVKAVVSLDLGLARGFDPASLAAIDVPVLVIAAATPNPSLPARLESRHLADHLPSATTLYVEIAGAVHFSFLPVCKPGAAALLEADAPREGIICGDDREGDRTAIHQQVTDLIVAFLADTLKR